jgi:hypothetical protein
MKLIKRVKTSRILWLLTRDLRGVLHRWQGRRIAHLLHVSKAGGIALQAALESYWNSGDYEIGLYGHAFDLTHFPRGEKVIFFLRDPVSRFVSAFNYRKRRGLPLIPIPWSRGEEAAFARFGTANELALALSSGDEERRAAARDAMASIEHVRTPQWTWFKDESYFLSRKSDILFIGFQETFAADFEILKRLLNLPEEVSLPDDEVAANRSPAGADKRLDDEAVRNLESWYQRDYRLLELCRGIRAEIQSDLERRFARPGPPEGRAATRCSSGPVDCDPAPAGAAACGPRE